MPVADHQKLHIREYDQLSVFARQLLKTLRPPQAMPVAVYQKLHIREYDQLSVFARQLLKTDHHKQCLWPIIRNYT